MSIMECARAMAVDWNTAIACGRGKAIFNCGDGRHALSILYFPEERDARAMLQRRQALIRDTAGCAGLNIPKIGELRHMQDGWYLIERMRLSERCPEDGEEEDALLDALQGLHGAGWVHMDVKPENMMRLDGRWTLHDFDSVMRIGERFSHRDITFSYAPPDVLRTTIADCSDDLYAAAMIMYRRRNGGRFPWQRGEAEWPANAARFILRRLPCPEGWTDGQKEFFRKALSAKRRERFRSVDAFRAAWKESGNG